MEDNSHAMSMETFELRFIRGLGDHSEMMIDKDVLLTRYLRATMARNPLPAPAKDIIKAVQARASKLGLDGQAIVAQAMGGQ